MRGRCEGASVMCTDLGVGGSHRGGRVGEASCKGQTTCDLHDDEM